jgi:hypothetical protein
MHGYRALTFAKCTTIIIVLSKLDGLGMVWFEMVLSESLCGTL